MKKVISSAILSCSLLGCSASYSDGYRVGYLQKLSKKGFIIKVVEGEMATDGIKSNQIDGRISSTWVFNVLDTNIEKQLANAGNKKVKIYYKEWMWANPITMSSPYEVIKVDIYE